MEYTVEELNEVNLYSLRNLAREVGVKAPASLKKSQLIKEIIDIKSGKKQPCTPTKKGRPVKASIENINISPNKKDIKTEKQVKKAHIKSILKEMEKTLNEIFKTIQINR